ncbi:MAG: peptide chain release factor N(5)-glutamine methyltransferase [Deltaproteobacteria bacterium]|nr:MAG: peptide chain release factor N(5)-glutamine methyltransferase [Deltaproteobacteria bacterium]
MTQRTWTIKEILNVTSEFLRDKQIESPRLCAEVLLSFQLRKTRVELYLSFDQPLRDSEVAQYRALVKRRLNREPLQYITGRQEFWSLEFVVNPSVMVPRPETEILVEEALNLKKTNQLPEGSGDQTRTLDLGTGSGAIAVSLAKEIEGAAFWATDISAEALAVARENAERHAVSGKITFCQGDLYKALEQPAPAFDMIISNPPYIASDAFDTLPEEVRAYEPRIALDGHEKGMYFIERIIADAENHLKPGGWLLIEMDPGQTEQALALIGETRSLHRQERLMDYHKNYRMIKAQREHG